jgi:hypothetical protein
VTGVYIYLVQIEAPDASGTMKVGWERSASLTWRHDPNQDPKTIGHFAECDLCHIIKGPSPHVKLSPHVPGQLPFNEIRSPFHFIFTLQASGVEADSNRIRIAVYWNGLWSDNPEEMANHLVVKQLR